MGEAAARNGARSQGGDETAHGEQAFTWRAKETPGARGGSALEESAAAGPVRACWGLGAGRAPVWPAAPGSKPGRVGRGG